jgi:shikimate kinase
MNLVFVGYRGTGKTVRSKIVAEKLGMQYIETDEEIEKLAGKKIPQIVAENGWSYFRKLEENAFAMAAKKNNVVISSGGGSIESAKNRKLMKTNSVVFWLRASPKTILARLQEDGGRPALTKKPPLQEIIDKTKERAPLYRQVANFVIDTDKLDEQQSAEMICRIFLRQRAKQATKMKSLQARRTKKAKPVPRQIKQRRRK